MKITAVKCILLSAPYATPGDAERTIHLQTGHLAGVGFDVFTEEPLPPYSPLWAMNNVIITPHVGGRSIREFDRLCDLFIINLERFMLGKPLLNQVIPELSITQRIHYV